MVPPTMKPTVIGPPWSSRPCSGLASPSPTIRTAGRSQHWMQGSNNFPYFSSFFFLSLLSYWNTFLVSKCAEFQHSPSQDCRMYAQDCKLQVINSSAWTEKPLLRHVCCMPWWIKTMWGRIIPYILFLYLCPSNVAAVGQDPFERDARWQNKEMREERVAESILGREMETYWAPSQV